LSLVTEKFYYCDISRLTLAVGPGWHHKSRKTGLNLPDMWKQGQFPLRCPTSLTQAKGN